MDDEEDAISSVCEFSRGYEIFRRQADDAGNVSVVGVRGRKPGMERRAKRVIPAARARAEAAIGGHRRAER